MSDYSEMEAAQRRLHNAVKEIRALTVSVGHAKQIREYDSERRRNLVATFMLSHIKDGGSVAAAEVHARANLSYQERLEALASQREACEKTIADWEAAFA